ncbi:MAG TPA: oligopeptide/dipeptide ABC transporter ATP-binding protein, partial [Nitrososphaerales archaeon]|nr:oligopeptide/dipeptide ABC transporter ATP-binding protein [Nitrososphaerales archaeon]
AGVIDSPIHPYTKLLVKATPKMVLSGKDNQVSLDLKGDSLIGSALDLPSGCRFHPRCSYALEKCRSTEPRLLERRIGELAACDVVPAEK